MSMRIRTIIPALAFLTSAAHAWAQAPPSAPDDSLAALLRYEPTGLSLISPYTRGRIPVVFVHGLWSNPTSWQRMIEALQEDPELAGRYQFWTFGYSTGDPILYSASLLRRDLKALRARLDPGRSDEAIDRMVIVGHSMGGLVSKAMVSTSADGLWRAISQRPFDEMRGEPEDLDVIRRCLFFETSPEIRRVVYIATPHGGSYVDRGRIERLGSRLVRAPDPLRIAHDRLISANGPAFFSRPVRETIPTSIEELAQSSPILTALAKLPRGAAVQAHSIIAARPGPRLEDRSDGLVRYPSAHVDGVVSEKVIATGHRCQEHPEVIGEVKRILAEHAAS